MMQAIECGRRSYHAFSGEVKSEKLQDIHVLR